MDYRVLSDSITEAVAFQLLNFESLNKKPPILASNEIAAMHDISEKARDRYQNDVVFHNKVVAITHNVMTIVMAQRDAALEVLFELSHCDFNNNNCASLEIASSRVRYLANQAIQKGNNHEQG